MKSEPPSQGFLVSQKRRLLENPGVKAFRIYWSLYGGWRGIFGSPYVYVAAFLTGVLYPVWTEIKDGQRQWASLPIDIIPSMLGFSMGGMAIMLAFSGATHFKHVAQGGDSRSLFIKVIANFFHFILVQTIAIFLAILASGNSLLAISVVAFWIFCYAILVGIATAGQLLRIGQVLNAAVSLPKEKGGDD